MMFITGNDQLPSSAALVVLRWAWRYRSELAPVYAASATFGVAWWLHAGHRQWSALVLAAAAAAAAALAALGGRAGLPTLTERLYVGVTTLTAGGWVAAAILGPFTTPMPQLLAAGGAVMSVLWWAHARRRARVRVERKLEAWPEIAQAVGLAGSQVMSAVVDVWGGGPGSGWPGARPSPCRVLFLRRQGLAGGATGGGCGSLNVLMGNLNVLMGNDLKKAWNWAHGHHASTGSPPPRKRPAPCSPTRSPSWKPGPRC